jgi:8-oxo-dGTP pyrophosphatase MutT (NUDIX family)/GNAT superfamily N-acetyltransferase
MPSDSDLRPLRREDCKALEDAFVSVGWSKPASKFERYCDEQASGDRWTCVAVVGGSLAGYVTVRWLSEDPFFAEEHIPEILDLNVLPALRRRGIGTRLIAEAERIVCERSDRVGLRVGLHPGYGVAQRLYAKRGYVPDGRGILHGREQLLEGAATIVDDELTIRLSKSLSRATASTYIRDLRQAIGNRLLLLPSVAVAVSDERGRLLMIQHAETREWGIPGGCIELGESPHAAARRELREETSVQVDSIELLAALGGAEFRHVYANGDQVEYSIFLFGALTSDCDPVPDGVEIVDARFFEPAHAPPLRWPYPHDLLWRGGQARG